MELVCERCKKIYSPEKNLTNHKNLVHAGKKYQKFTCNPCQEKYQESKSRDDHNTIYNCDQCNTKFKTIIGLTNHKTSCNKHSLMYDCDICNFTCKSIGNLRLHARGKHNGPFYSCDMCPHTTTLKKYLLKHLRKEHKTLSAVTTKGRTIFEKEFQSIKDKKEQMTGDYKPEPLIMENFHFSVIIIYLTKLIFLSQLQQKIFCPAFYQKLPQRPYKGHQLSWMRNQKSVSSNIRFSVKDLIKSTPFIKKMFQYCKKF